MISQDEFEERYAALNGIPVAQVHAVPCDCGEDECPGWQVPA